MKKKTQKQKIASSVNGLMVWDRMMRESLAKWTASVGTGVSTDAKREYYIAKDARDEAVDELMALGIPVGHFKGE